MGSYDTRHTAIMPAMIPHSDRSPETRKLDPIDVGEGSYIIPEGAVGAVMVPLGSKESSVAPGASAIVRVPHCTSDPVKVDVHESCVGPVRCPFV